MVEEQAADRLAGGAQSSDERRRASNDFCDRPTSSNHGGRTATQPAKAQRPGGVDHR